MKLNRLETHDRLLHFKKDQEANVFQGAEDCLKRNPLSLALQDKCHYVYLFAHPRIMDEQKRMQLYNEDVFFHALYPDYIREYKSIDDVKKATTRMLWQPRLTKPAPQTNSYLFRAISKTDVIEVCWLLPPRELWNQYRQGNVTEDNEVLWSINEFETNRKNMGKAAHDDLTDEKIKTIYKQIVQNKENATLMI